jgi:hypothetical protein
MTAAYDDRCEPAGARDVMTTGSARYPLLFRRVPPVPGGVMAMTRLELTMSEPVQSTMLSADDSGLTAVRAHRMLGTVAAARGAVAAAILYEVTGSGPDGLLLMALRRLDMLSEQLRDLVAGTADGSTASPIDLRTAPNARSASQQRA